MKNLILILGTVILIPSTTPAEKPFKAFFYECMRLGGVVLVETERDAIISTIWKTKSYVCVGKKP